MSFSVGDKVGVNQGAKDYYGTSLAHFVFNTTYDVIMVGGNGLSDDRIVIGLGSAVTAAMHDNDLYLISASGSNGSDVIASTPNPDYLDTSVTILEDAMSSEGIESVMTQLMNSSLSNYDSTALNINMRLFGLPYQFTPAVDYRIEGVNKYVGRKYLENIAMEAPLLTLIPGKPKFLPGSKNRKGTGHALLQGANNTISDIANLFTESAIDNESESKYIRYYDFQQDYTTYMKYVNVLCRVAAGFLELTTAQDEYGNPKYTIDGTPLTKYDWKNYRWNSWAYTSAVGTAVTDTANTAKSFVKMLREFGGSIVSLIGFDGLGNKIAGNKVEFDTAGESDDDLDAASSFESLLKQVNFIQFYVNPSVSFNESGRNETTESKLKSAMDSGTDLMHEIAFLANSGGVEWSDIENMGDAGLDQLAGALTSGGGTVSTAFNRILNAGRTVVRGDRLIIPKIYTDSSYDRNYSFTVDLKCPRGNKFEYYMEVLVPLMHLLALSIPKQTTANTFGAPFLVKGYYPGVAAINLGIIDSISIDKNPASENWTVDGLPAEMSVTISIIDLYSDLTLTPSNEPIMFLSNSSLIDYLAVSCGLDLVQPQLANKINFYTDLVTSAFTDIPANVTGMVDDVINRFKESFVGIDKTPW